MKWSVTLVLVMLTASACSSPEPGKAARATGPAYVVSSTVDSFARIIDNNFDPRPPGSQKESLTSSFLLAHMAKLGYSMRLDSVPVAHTVDSANIQATPPGAKGKPSEVVTVAYDTSPAGGHQGASLGEWLEIARVMAVKGAPAGLEMAALGAEHARSSGGQLGSRRLAKVLLDASARPSMITIGSISGHGYFAALGPDARPMLKLAARLHIPLRKDAIPPPTPARPDVFAEAGFNHTTVAGSPRAVGDVLVRFLTGSSGDGPG